jgi:hypothetical protein
MFSNIILPFLLAMSFFFPILTGPQTILAQTDQRNTINASSADEDIDVNDSFSAIGQIASLVITVPDSGLILQMHSKSY